MRIGPYRACGPQYCTRELRRRMNNNLQVVSSLLDWRLDGLQDPRVRAMVQECQGRIGVMARSAHLYHADDLERAGLGVYLPRLPSR